MIYGPRNQAIYIFQRDSKNKTELLRRVRRRLSAGGLPRSRLVLRGGAKQSLVGTVKRRDGSLQVTYAGQPLYYYVNEGPGEVRCHNVNLNGGPLVGDRDRRQAAGASRL